MDLVQLNDAAKEFRENKNTSTAMKYSSEIREAFSSSIIGIEDANSRMDEIDRFLDHMISLFDVNNTLYKVSENG